MTSWAEASEAAKTARHRMRRGSVFMGGEFSREAEIGRDAADRRRKTAYSGYKILLDRGMVWFAKTLSDSK